MARLLLQHAQASAWRASAPFVVAPLTHGPLMREPAVHRAPDQESRRVASPESPEPSAFEGLRQYWWFPSDAAFGRRTKRATLPRHDPFSDAGCASTAGLLTLTLTLTLTLSAEPQRIAMCNKMADHERTRRLLSICAMSSVQRKPATVSRTMADVQDPTDALLAASLPSDGALAEAAWG